MTIHYYTNSAETTKSLTEWFFRKGFRHQGFRIFEEVRQVRNQSFSKGNRISHHQSFLRRIRK